MLESEKVRSHIKDAVLRLLRSLPDPTAGEWAALESLLGENPAFEDRLWDTLRSVGWFDRLSAEGTLEAWLSGEEDGPRGRAVDIMVSAARDRVDDVTELLIYSGAARRGAPRSSCCGRPASHRSSGAVGSSSSSSGPLPEARSQGRRPRRDRRRPT